ncbi:MAG: homoserine kinase [Burkholderiales bacterium]|nr:homoserine kinase [Burkholderiales bacterium]
MSVYTPLTDNDARAFLRDYALGDLESLKGIESGVENSNFFLTTTTGEYVLTIFEKQSAADLNFYLALMDYLAENGFSCPRPQPRFGEAKQPMHYGMLHGKPATIVTKLPGAAIDHPTADDCHAVGRLLAHMHDLAVDFDMSMDNWRGAEWREFFAIQAAPKLTTAENELIASENDFQARINDADYPVGIIHADLFRDNILWAPDDEGGPGVIDWYFACDDLLLYDLAITVNDWCINPDATIDRARHDAMVAGYRELRELEAGEAELWPAMLRRAALRTWLGRLGYNHFPQAGEMVIKKDHGFSERLLRHHIAHAEPLK